MVCWLRRLEAAAARGYTSAESQGSTAHPWKEQSKSKDMLCCAPVRRYREAGKDSVTQTQPARAVSLYTPPLLLCLQGPGEGAASRGNAAVIPTFLCIPLEMLLSARAI